MKKTLLALLSGCQASGLFKVDGIYKRSNRHSEIPVTASTLIHDFDESLLTKLRNDATVHMLVTNPWC